MEGCVGGGSVRVEDVVGWGEVDCFGEVGDCGGVIAGGEGGVSF